MIRVRARVRVTKLVYQIGFTTLFRAQAAASISKYQQAAAAAAAAASN